MAIEKRVLSDGSTRYVARVWDPVLNRKVSKTFSRRKDAEKAEADMKIKMFTGEMITRSKDVLFSVHADEVLALSTVSPETYAEYKHIHQELKRLVGPKSVRQLTVKHVEGIVAELSRTKAPNTVNKYVIRLRHVLRRAVAYGYITVSPAEHIANKPRIRNVRRMEILTSQEIKSLLNECGDYWRPLFVLWLASGLRIAEIFGLGLESIDIANGRIHVRQQLKEGQIVPYTKSRRPRTIDVSSEVLAIVVQHMMSAPHDGTTERVVFPSVTGRPVHVSDWYRDVWRPLVKRIGRPGIGTHALRHTFASRALSAGVNVKVLQQMLGHADAALTLGLYSHLIPSDARIAADKMAEFLLHEQDVTTDGHSDEDADCCREVA